MFADGSKVLLQHNRNANYYRADRTNGMQSTIQVKLGRKAVKTDSRTLRLATYLPSKLAPPPDKVDWSKGITDWGMMCNDRLGCCTIAGAAHAVQTWTVNAAGEVTLPDSVVETYYSLWDGYIKGDSTTDNGGVELDVLTRWRKDTLSGHQLAAYAAVHPAKSVDVKQAIALFGGVYIGVNLPASAQAQTGTLWDASPDPVPSADYIPGSWGGHCVWVLAYTPEEVVCITWGKLQRMSWRFWNAYVDEAYALLSPDFLNANGLDPQGFCLADLQRDLLLVR